MKCRLLIILLCICSVSALNAQRLAVKSNVMLDGLSTPNVGFELATGKASSLSLSILNFRKCLNLRLDAVGVQPEYKFWYSNVAMSRGYVGVIGLAGFYKGRIGSRYYDGYGVGLGLSTGYVFNLTTRWNLELSTGFGPFYYHQKNYEELTEPEDIVPYKAYALIPLQLGVSISYIIK